MNPFKLNAKKGARKAAAAPVLKVLDPIDFQRVNGGSGTGDTSTTEGGRLLHHAGASNET